MLQRAASPESPVRRGSTGPASPAFHAHAALDVSSASTRRRWRPTPATAGLTTTTMGMTRAPRARHAAHPLQPAPPRGGTNAPFSRAYGPCDGPHGHSGTVPRPCLPSPCTMKSPQRTWALKAGSPLLPPTPLPSLPPLLPPIVKGSADRRQPTAPPTDCFPELGRPARQAGEKQLNVHSSIFDRCFIDEKQKMGRHLKQNKKKKKKFF